MGRGHYPPRLKVEAPSPEVAAHYLHIWPGELLYHTPERVPQVSSSGLFGNQRPLMLDLGCATGDVIVALAAQNPTINYVGVDLVLKPLWCAVERASAAGLTNLRFIQADARLFYRQIPDAALQTAYVHFPAPLLRQRKRRQRLISPLLLRQMQRCLVPGGMLSVMTDEPAVYAELLTLLPAAPALQVVSDAAVTALDPLEALPKSQYHRRWEARGRPIQRVLIIRQPD